eukprot:gene6965-biopygen632
MYTQAQLDDAVAVAVADAVAAERVRTDAVQRAYKTLLAQTHEQHRLLNQALSLVSKQDEEIENLNLMLLVAKILGVKSEGADSDVFALMEDAMNVMGIHNLLPQSARRVDISEVATELLYGDQILIRTAEAWKLLSHGDHIVVMVGGWRHGYAHHGIVLRESRLDQDPDIAHFTSPSGDRRMRDARLQIDTYINFLARHTTYGIVQYTSPTDFADKLVHRKRAANIAKFMVETPSTALRNKYCYNHVKQDSSFKEESNASEEPMTTTVEDYDALLRELENCRIKNQTLIKHNDELKLISETTMHENILLKSQLVPELSPYHFGHDLLTSLNLPFCNTKCCIVLLDSSGARQCKKNRQATGLLCTTHASSPKHVAEKVNKAYATRCFERHAKVISASQTQSDCVAAYTSACDDNNSAAVKSAYDSAVSASNQTYGIGSLDSDGNILLRGNLRISETANIYREDFSSLFVNFTGQHRCFVDALAPARLRDHEGLVVVTDKNAYASGLLRGRQRAMTINQALPIVSLSKVPKDPRAFGVISLTQDHPAGPSAAISVTELLKIAEQGDVRVQINSVGEGCIWVCDETGSTIHAGDYVTTSSLSGYASLQVLDDGDVPDGTLRNYTVAKLTMDCDFSQPLVDVEEVQKDEYGNVVFDADGSLVYTIVTTTQGPSVVDPDTGETRTGEPLETPIPVTEPAYEMRWMTTEIDASSGVSITTLISKEVYEKQHVMEHWESWDFRPDKDKSKSLDTIQRYFAAADGDSVHVEYAKNKHGRGRLFAKRGLSMQCVMREVRNAVAHPFNVDLDFVNCHPTLFSQRCRKRGVACPLLDQYCGNRTEVLGDIDADAALGKTAVLSVMNGSKTAVYKHQDSVWLRDFQNEMNQARDEIMAPGGADEFYIDIARKDRNTYASAVNLMLCDLENECLMAMLEYLDKKSFKVGVLVFDGAMVEKKKEFADSKDGGVTKYSCLYTKAINIVKTAKHYIPVDDNFVKKIWESNLGVLCFRNGVFRFRDKSFAPFSERPEVMPVIVIDRDFPSERPTDELLEHVKEKVLVSTLGEEGRVNTYLQMIARSMAAKHQDKQWGMLIGERNSGKGLLQALNERAWGQYVNTIDSSVLMLNNFTNDVKSQGWMIECEFTRQTYTNEIKVDPGNKHIKLDGGLIKKFQSGGDVLKARQLYENERALKSASRLFMNLNDLPEIQQPLKISDVVRRDTEKLRMDEGDELSLINAHFKITTDLADVVTVADVNEFAKDKKMKTRGLRGRL